MRTAPVVQPLEPRQLFAGGQPDTFFNHGSVPAGSNADADAGYAGEAVQVLAAADGGYYALTNLYRDQSVPRNGPARGVAVIKFASDGVPDASFGIDGRTVLTTLSGVSGAGMAISAGKIVIAGTATTSTATNGSQDIVLMRVDAASGAPDTSFGSGGFATQNLQVGTSINSDDVVTGMAVGPDGEYYVDGTTNIVGQAGTFKYFVAKFLTGGTIDTGWGSGGTFTFTSATTGNFSPAGPMAVDSSNRAYLGGSFAVGGNLGVQLAALRVSAAGGPDPTFGSNGVGASPNVTQGGDATAGGYTISVSPAGVLIGGETLGSNEGNGVLARLTFAGVADATYGASGFTLVADAYYTAAEHVDDGTGRAMLLLRVPDNTGTRNVTRVWRFDSSGNVDGTFNGGSPLDLPFAPGGYGIPVGAFTASGGAIIGGGQNQDQVNSQFGLALAAVKANGSLDATFNPHGATPGVLPVTGQFAQGAAATASIVKALKDSSYVVASTSFDAQGGAAVLLSRYLSTGGLAGTARVALPSLTTLSLGGLVQLPNGKFLVVASAFSTVVGQTSGAIYIVRFNADGSVDATLNGNGVAVSTPEGAGAYTVVGAQYDAVSGDVYVMADGATFTSAIYRFTTDGIFDGTFAPQAAGSFSLQATSPGALAVQPDGKVLAAVTYNNGLAVVRFARDGSVDTTFGSGGVFLDDFDAQRVVPNAMTIDSSGHVYVGGAFMGTNTTQVTFLARIGATGMLDDGFGSHGLMTGQISGPAFGDTAINALVVDEFDGVEFAGSEGDVPLVGRIKPDGTLDADFGGEQATYHNAAGKFSSVDFTPHGDTVAAGIEASATSVQASFVQRFTQFTTYVLPTVTLEPAADVHYGDTEVLLTIDVTSDPKRTVDISTLPAHIKVIGMDPTPIFPTLKSTTPSNGGQAVRAVYSFTAPNGTFTPADNGGYTVFNLDGISDSRGLYAFASELGAFSVNLVPPVIAASTPVTPTAGTASLAFTVTITPDVFRTVLTSTLGDGDITVSLPGGGTGVATLVSTSLGDDNVLDATFNFAPTGGFTAGSYTFRAVDAAVTDDALTPSAATPLFTLRVGATTTPSANPVLTSATVAPGGYTPGQNVLPSAAVQNSGSADAGMLFVRFDLLRADGSTVVALGTESLASLSTGASATVASPVGYALPSTTVVPEGSYKVQAVLLSADGATVLDTRPAGTIRISSVPPRRPGVADPTFGGGDGTVDSYADGSAFRIAGVVAEPGQIVFAGGTQNGDLALARFLADGSLDAAFGRAGIATVDLGGTDAAVGMATSSSGQIYVAGTSQTEGQLRFAVARFSSDGSLDASYGSGGTVFVTLPEGYGAVDLGGIAVDPSGHVYLAGAVTNPAGQQRAAILRLTPAGALDAAFSSDGLFTLEEPNARKPVLPAGNAGFTTVIVTPKRILAGGYIASADGATSRSIVTGVDANGVVVKSFGTTGTYVGPAIAGQLARVTALVPGLKDAVYVGGSQGTSAGTTPTLIRLTSGGKLDKGFNKGASPSLSANTTFGTTASLLLQTLGKNDARVLVATSTAASLADGDAGNLGTATFRVTGAGAQDPSFDGGHALVPLVATSDATGGGSPDALERSKQGSATLVDGNLVREVTARPTAGGTVLSVVQITPDGADLTATLGAVKPATAKQGAKASLTLSVTNNGSLPAGPFSVNLVARMSDGTTFAIAPLSVKQLLAGGGAKKNVKVSIPVPKSATVGTYDLAASIVLASDLEPANNAAAGSATIAVTSSGKAR